MIDYSRLHDKEYFNNVKKDIGLVTDTFILANILKGLSFKIADRSIEPDIANELLLVVKERLSILTDIRQTNRNQNNNGRDRGNFHKNSKILTLSPTSVSNKNGKVTIIFLAVNIAITTAMYTMLVIAHLIK